MTRLARLLEEVQACRVCVEHPEGPPLPHAPRPVLQVSSTAKLLIASQAPGTKVHVSGRPFTDASGERLRQWLGIGPDIFYDASRVAVVPMGLCFPGQDEKGADLPPRRECAGEWRALIMAQLSRVELIVAAGHYAQAWHLKGTCKATLTETVKAWRESYRSLQPPVIPLPHPSWRNNAWIAGNRWFERELLPLLRDEVRRLVA